jgi:F-type H+-transporting ATPase subunit a
MEHHFSWLSLVPGLNLLPDHTASATLVAGLLILLALAARRQLAAAPDAVVPNGTMTARNAMEIYIDWFAGLADSVIGPGGRRYVHVYGTFFLFILFANLLGMVPGFSPPTSNFNVTLALGLCSFVLFNYYGMRAHGVGAYVRHFLGPVAMIAPLLFVLEVLSAFIRPLTLGLRLAANMTADHLVIGIFTDLTKLVIPAVFYALALLVSLLQAFVFTLLSLIYVALAVGGHDEEHGHGEHGGKGAQVHP